MIFSSSKTLCPESWLQTIVENSVIYTLITIYKYNLFVLKYSPQSCTATSSLLPDALFFTPEQFYSLPLRCQIALHWETQTVCHVSLRRFKCLYVYTQKYTHTLGKDTRSDCSTLLKQGYFVSGFPSKGCLRVGKAPSQPSGGEFTCTESKLPPRISQHSLCHVTFKAAISDSAWSLQPALLWGHLQSESVMQQSTITTFQQTEVSLLLQPRIKLLSKNFQGVKNKIFPFFFPFKLSWFNELDKLLVRIAKKTPPLLECLHLLKRQLALALI